MTITTAETPGVDVPTFLFAHTHDAGKVSSEFANVLQRAIATADRLRSDLAGGNAQLFGPVYGQPEGPWQSASLLNGNNYSHPGAADPAAPASWHAGGAVTTTTSAGNWFGYVPAVVAPTITLTTVSPPVRPTGRSWFAATPLSFHVANPPSSDQILFNAGAPEAIGAPGADRGIWDETNAESIAQRELPHINLIRLGLFNTNAASAFVTAGPLPDVRLIVRLSLAPDLREQMLRLVDGIRSTLRLMLIRVLGALSRRPNALGFGLVLLAIARCFGHRGEPDDDVLPVRMPISVVIGEAAGSV